MYESTFLREKRYFKHRPTHNNIDNVVSDAFKEFSIEVYFIINKKDFLLMVQQQLHKVLQHLVVQMLSQALLQMR